MEYYSKKQIEKIKSKLTPVDCEEMFDESFGGSTVKIGGYEYDEATALREVDPVAYRCGVADYIDSCVGNGLSDEIDGEHYMLGEIEELLENEEEEDEKN